MAGAWFLHWTMRPMWSVRGLYRPVRVCDFLARDVIYTSRAYAMMPIRLSVCHSVMEMHWRIIANLGFKFRSHFIAHCGRRAAGWRRAACG